MNDWTKCCVVWIWNTVVLCIVVFNIQCTELILFFLIFSSAKSIFAFIVYVAL